ncbi:MAG: DUF86 domain-containing protein [Lascolabacillus sp.]|nr:DUF86 domain-containing protein [Lascolabacillus sp.]
MSDRDYRLYLHDILDSGQAIQDFVKGYAFDDFERDRKTYSAVIREFEIIGECVGKLPDTIKQTRPEVAWQDIKDFRNLLVHEYFGVDMAIIWQVVQDDLPLLLKATSEILAGINREKK